MASDPDDLRWPEVDDEGRVPGLSKAVLERAQSRRTAWDILALLVTGFGAVVLGLLRAGSSNTGEVPLKEGETKS